MQPLIWTGTGKLVGSLAQFEKECGDKYNLRLDEEARRRQHACQGARGSIVPACPAPRQIAPSTWAKIAQENLAHAEAAAAGASPTSFTGHTWQVINRNSMENQNIHSWGLQCRNNR